jgi:hypothetical protein
MTAASRILKTGCQEREGHAMAQCEPGVVRVVVWCASCGAQLRQINSDSGERLTGSDGTDEDIRIVLAARTLAARDGRQCMASGGPHLHEDHEPGSVTMTEVYDGEGFRPFD